MELLSDRLDLDKAHAYEVQDRVVRERCRRTGADVAGYKVSAVSRQVQESIGLEEPVYGTLTTHDPLPSPATISLRAMFAPLLEPELMFLVQERLSPGADVEEIMACCTLAAGIEVPDSRFRCWYGRVRTTDLICDNACTGRVVVGDRLDPPPALQTISVRLRRDGATLAEGSSASVMGHPALAVAWLTRKLADRGRRLERGMVVSSGTFVTPAELSPGDYEAVYAGSASARLTVVA